MYILDSQDKVLGRKTMRLVKVLWQHRGQSGTGVEGWAIHTDGSLRYMGWVVVPQLTDLREEILQVFHYSRFAMRPGGMKMYRDLCR